jgi:hypothetical protein
VCAGLVDSLCKNKHLVDIDLYGGWALGVCTANAVSNLLRSLESLESLCIGDLEANEVMVIASAVEHNLWLQQLHVRTFKETWDNHRIEALKGVLQNNFSLLQLTIEGTAFGDQLIDCSDISDKNRSLWRQHATLRALAYIRDSDFNALWQGVAFRDKLLEYFLPVAGIDGAACLRLRQRLCSRHFQA